MNRTFLLPLSALTLGVSGCTEEPVLVGQWTGISLVDDYGATQALPLVDTYNDSGTTTVVSTSVTLDVTATGATWVQTDTYSDTADGDTETSSDVLSYAGAWSDENAPRFFLDFDWDALDMDCVLDGDDLTCVNTAPIDLAGLTFERD